MKKAVPLAYVVLSFSPKCLDFAHVERSLLYFCALKTVYVNYESVGFLFHRFWSHSVNIETGVFCFYAFVYSTRTHDQFTVRRSSTITYRLNMTVNVKFSFVLLSSIGDES